MTASYEVSQKNSRLACLAPKSKDGGEITMIRIILSLLFVTSACQRGQHQEHSSDNQGTHSAYLDDVDPLSTTDTSVLDKIPQTSVAPSIVERPYDPPQPPVMPPEVDPLEHVMPEAVAPSIVTRPDNPENPCDHMLVVYRQLMGAGKASEAQQLAKMMKVNDCPEPTLQ